MLLLVFFIAVLNLSVGYALGAGLSLASLLDLLPRRTKKPETGDISDDEELTRPAPGAPAKLAAGSESIDEPTVDAEKKTKKRKPRPSPAEVIASLQSFQAELSTASSGLKDNVQDGEQFGESATKLQEVNHAYLEEAEGAIEHLDKLGAAGDELASATSKAVAEGAEGVAQLSGELDSLIEGGLSEQSARDQLLETTDRLVKVTESAEQAAEKAIVGSQDAADPPDDSEPDAVSQPLDSIDDLFERLETAFAEAEAESTHYVAAIRVDPITDHEDDSAVAAFVETRISELTQKLLGEAQPFVAGHPTMALLNGDDFEAAADRVERIRQQVEATTFQSEAGDLQATVTCAVVDTHAEDPRDRVIELLNLAMDEAGRQGFNQSYHHDGAFPTPLEPRSVETEPKVVAI